MKQKLSICFVGVLSLWVFAEPSLQNFQTLVVGMPEAEVIKLVGDASYVTETPIEGGEESGEANADSDSEEKPSGKMFKRSLSYFPTEEKPWLTIIDVVDGIVVDIRQQKFEH